MLSFLSWFHVRCHPSFSWHFSIGRSYGLGVSTCLQAVGKATYFMSEEWERWRWTVFVDSVIAWNKQRRVGVNFQIKLFASLNLSCRYLGSERNITMLGLRACTDCVGVLLRDKLNTRSWHAFICVIYWKKIKGKLYVLLVEALQTLAGWAISFISSFTIRRF